MLEPRRLAARAAARRVAAERGERVGETVGFQVRFEDVSGPSTRLRYLTEGILARRMVSDPTLARVGAVLLDEFHERHLAGDVALARFLKLQATSRPDLVVGAMSATLDARALVERMGAPSLVRSEGRAFPVEVEHAAVRDDRPLETQVAAAVGRVVAAGPGDVLVFLPGRLRDPPRGGRAPGPRVHPRVPRAAAARRIAPRRPGPGAASRRPAPRRALDERGRDVGHGRGRDRRRRLGPRARRVRRSVDRAARAAGREESRATRRRSAPGARGARRPGAACASSRGPTTTRVPSTARPRSAASTSPRPCSSFARRASATSARSRGSRPRRRPRSPPPRSCSRASGPSTPRARSRRSVARCSRSRCRRGSRASS